MKEFDSQKKNLNAKRHDHEICRMEDIIGSLGRSQRSINICERRLLSIEKEN
jgi:hypothetical protein